MNVHLATETANWIVTWEHFSVNNAINTALSADHVAAEIFVEILTGLILYKAARWLFNRWTKRHDVEVHSGHTTIERNDTSSWEYDIHFDSAPWDCDGLVFDCE